MKISMIVYFYKLVDQFIHEEFKNLKSFVITLVPTSEFYFGNLI